MGTDTIRTAVIIAELSIKKFAAQEIKHIFYKDLVSGAAKRISAYLSALACKKSAKP